MSGNKPWTPATKVAFRFATIYFVLYLLPFPLSTIFGSIPLLGQIAQWYNGLRNTIATWVGPFVGLEVVVQPTGSGDTALAFATLFATIVLSVVGTVIWSLLDRNRPNYDRMYDLLRVYVRYGLGVIMLGYGAFKIIPTQFPYPALVRLLEPLGNSSPMGLLWKLMGYSVAFNVFTGLGEFIGGLLLFFRRTTTLGALLLIAVLSNVVMMNFSFDVPVKLYSANLLLMAMFLVLPDLTRLINVLLANRPTAPRDLQSVFPAGRWRAVGLGVKTLFIGWAVWSTLSLSYQFFTPQSERPEFYGIHEVETFVRNGDTVPALMHDSTRWQRLIVDGNTNTARATIQMMNGPLQGPEAHNYRFSADTAAGTFTLRSTTDTSVTHELQYTQLSQDLVRLNGVWNMDTLSLDLRRFDESTFLLTATKFKWVAEFPFNR